MLNWSRIKSMSLLRPSLDLSIREFMSYKAKWMTWWTSNSVTQVLNSWMDKENCQTNWTVGSTMNCKDSKIFLIIDSQIRVQLLLEHQKVRLKKKQEIWQDSWNKNYAIILNQQISFMKIESMSFREIVKGLLKEQSKKLQTE